MIAIETKYLGPTNQRGARYTASTANGHRLTRSADDSLNSDENQYNLAVELANKYQWLDRPSVRLVGGSTKAGMVFVFVEG